MSAPTTPADPAEPERAADGAAPTPDATPTTPVDPAPAPAPAAQAAQPAPAPAAAAPSRAPRALAITGIAVGAVLLLAVTFGAGALVGRHLPGPGPVGFAGAVERGGPFDGPFGGGDRVGPGERGDRLGALTDEQREQIREWIEEGMSG